MKKPWPGMARTIYGDHERFERVYFSKFNGYYTTGDGEFLINVHTVCITNILAKTLNRGWDQERERGWGLTI